MRSARLQAVRTHPVTFCEGRTAASADHNATATIPGFATIEREM
jgi:hypothetical protein